VSAFRRRRRQLAFKVSRARLKALLETWRERTAPNELLFQSRRQAVFLGEPWRKMAFMLVIPPAHVFAVVICVVVLGIIT
jgi:hypothetical protein